MTAHWSILLQNPLGSYSWSLFYDMSKFFFFFLEKLRTALSLVGILIRLVLIEKGNAPASLDGFKSLRSSPVVCSKLLIYLFYYLLS
ncbi:unnamed protein product [Musa acuminata subsp. malaccensis]|uniref:(wild Malaysian banana) hypothetical protein n=1 Tax=Musa acuminata subsp. malaccensis TaxID=214687 RepID=A0A804HX51_MUSAM|nr:unnamed protein product [Musa acuminata subsp. malaccensis]